VADRDGFDAVTLRRIAAELDVHVTSLYNHVPTREAITDGITERLIEEAKLPSTPVAWETWVRGFVASIETIAATHPGAFAALYRRPVQGVHAATSFELGLAAFHAAGFDGDDAYRALKATALTALSIGLERAVLSQGELLETDVARLPVEDFPHLHALPTTDDTEATWAFAQETLIAGLRTQLRRHKRQLGR